MVSPDTRGNVERAEKCSEFCPPVSLWSLRGGALWMVYGMSERRCFVMNLRWLDSRSTQSGLLDPELPEHSWLGLYVGLVKEHLWLWAPDEPRSEDQDL